MPVRVHIRTRLRADPGTLVEQNAAAIGDALAAAAHRALLHSRAEVIEKLGGAARVQLGDPVISWSGERAAEIGPATRTLIEQAVNAALARAIRRSAIGGHPIHEWAAVAMPAGSATLAFAVSEEFDPERFDPVRGTYLVDSYEGGIEEVGVTSTAPKPVTIADYVAVVKVASDIKDPEAIAKLQELSEQASAAHPLGVIYRTRADSVTKWDVLITTGGPDLVAAFFGFQNFTRREFLGPKASPMFKKVVVVPPPGPATAEIVLNAPNPDAFKEQYRKLARQNLAGFISHNPTPVRVTTKSFHHLLETGLEQAVDQDVASLPQSVTKGVLVRLSGTETLIWFGSDAASSMNWVGKAKLTPIIAFEHRVKDRKPPPKGAEDLDRTKTGGTGPCPHDDRPDDHPPDDVEDSLENVPFLGEPALSEIGDAGEALKEKIASLASKLGLKGCDFAGRFCYQAASQLVDLATVTQSMAETATGQNAPARAAKGNMGTLDFAPTVSPIIARVRQLGGVVAELGHLINYVGAVYSSDAYRCTIHGIWRGSGTSWALRFREAVVPLAKQAVGQLFVGAGRSMLLQLLATSLIEIEKRLAAMPRYGVLFERWIVPLIADAAELETMRRKLRDQPIVKAVAAVGAAGTATGQVWLAATAALVVSVKGNPYAHDTGAPYEIVQDGGIDKIRDRKGRLWSKDDLEQALALKGQIAQGADPLVKQFVDTPEAIQRLKDADSISDELTKLLNEMALNNKEMTRKADDDAWFAFQASQISEDIPHATIPDSKYSLQGIHKVAHDQIGDAFQGSGLYAAGIDDLFDTEEGKKALWAALLMTGFVLLCVLVPGGAFIAFAAGGVLAAHELGSAYEKKRLYRSLIDPDLVLSHAEVEAAIFVAWFGAVLAAIPEAGTLTKGLIAGGRAVLKGETKALGKIAVKAVAVRVAKEVAEYAAKDLLAAFVKELTLNFVMDQVIKQAMGPVIQYIQHEASAGVDLGSAASDPTDDGGEREFIEMIRAAEPL